MEQSRPTTRAIFGIVALSMAMFFALLVPAPTADAAASGNPCPHFSIQDVFDDPNGNWDGDQINNSDELYNGLNPCIVDSASVCNPGGNPICNYPVYANHHYLEVVRADTVNNPCHRSTFLFPLEDYDRDGVINQHELNAGTDPCVYNAPALVQPCPHYNVHQVTAAPHYDWDGDGVSNLVEWRRGTNPCVAPVVYQQPVTVYVQPRTHRLPHVANTLPTATVQRTRPLRSAPVVQTVAACPAGYPYAHPSNGLCYANPVRHLFS